jgi:hypothetical protein
MATKKQLLEENRLLSRQLLDALDARDKAIYNHLRSVNDMVAKLQKLVDNHSVSKLNGE